ncbi:MAG: DNA polymerase III subunit delta [Candidatus Dadabacteria bacterium]
MKKKTAAKAGYAEFSQALASGKLAPIIVFTGDQTYLAEKAVAELRKGLLGESGDMGFTLAYGESASGKEIADNASTYPMFSGKKLIVVRNAEKLPAKETAALEGYFAAPSPSTCLVLDYTGGKKPKLPKADIGQYDFSTEKGGTTGAVVEAARVLGYEISRPAAEALVTMVGEDMRDIQNQLEKIALYKGEDKKITPADVDALTVRTKYADIYQLINAISRKDRKTAYKVLLDLEAAGEEPLSILGLVTWRFRLLWRAKELSEKRTPQAEMIKQLKISPGQLYYLGEDLKKFKYAELLRIMETLSEYDKKLKLSYVPKSFVLTKMVIDLCGTR